MPLLLLHQQGTKTLMKSSSTVVVSTVGKKWSGTLRTYLFTLPFVSPCTPRRIVRTGTVVSSISHSFRTVPFFAPTSRGRREKRNPIKHFVDCGGGQTYFRSTIWVRWRSLQQRLLLLALRTATAMLKWSWQSWWWFWHCWDFCSCCWLVGLLSLETQH